MLIAKISYNYCDITRCGLIPIAFVAVFKHVNWGRFKQWIPRTGDQETEDPGPGDAKETLKHGIWILL